MSGHCVSLWTLLSGNDVEFDLIAFLQRLVSIHLDCRVMHKNVRSIFTADKAETFRVVEPLDCAFVLSHRISSFLFSSLAAFEEAAA